MRNLVLGSSGYVGKSLVRYLQDKGQRVDCYDIRANANQDLRIDNLPFEIYDRIYFLAWEVGGSKYLYNPHNQEFQLKWNIDILTNTMPQLSKAKKPFLFVSSQQSGEYSAYGISKQAGEYWTRLMGGSVVRLWNFYGDIEEPGEKAHVASDIIVQALTTGEIHLMTRGDEERWFTYADDACRGFELALASRPYSIYDVAGPQSESVRHIAEIVAEETGAGIFFGTKPTDYGDKRKPNYLPGYTPKVYVDEGIVKMIERYRKLHHVTG